MPKLRTTRCDRIITDYARSQGLTDIQIVAGKKHRKLYLNGRMVAVVSHGDNDHGDRGMKNLFATIKRFAAGALPA